MQFAMGETIAVFRSNKTGKRVFIKATMPGGIYRQWEDSYAGGQAAHICRWDMEDIASGLLVVEQSPQSLYHCWHICQCADCARVGGRVYDHSQGTWNDHLKRTPNELLFTFPTVTGGA